MRRTIAVAAMASIFGFVGGPAWAVHFYRGEGGGCTPAEGELGSATAEPDAEIMLLHNTYNDAANGLPVTIIEAGQTVRWTWNSEHCHSVSSGTAFESGFHYPAPEPTTPAAVPGAFHYPVPEFDDPKLSFAYTFTVPGQYVYSCVHHALIGMAGIVVVQ